MRAYSSFEIEKLLKRQKEEEMKALIISDTHGKYMEFENLMKQVGPIDHLFHLGDIGNGETFIRSMAGCPVDIVAGNNDYFNQLEDELEVEWGGKKIFMSHGHRYLVNFGVDKIAWEGLSRGADIVMFGHTHMPYLEVGEEITILNPGSLTYPRQPDRKGTYMIMETDAAGKIHYCLNYI